MSLVDTASKLIDRFGIKTTLSRPSSSIDPITGLKSGTEQTFNVVIVAISDQEFIRSQFGTQGRSLAFYIDASVPVQVGDSLLFRGDRLSVVEVAPSLFGELVALYLVRVES